MHGRTSIDRIAYLPPLCVRDGSAVALRRGCKGKRRSAQFGSLLGCAAVWLFWLCAGFHAWAAVPVSPAALRVLHTTREVRDLSGQEAARGYPVHLKATVLFCDPPNIALFVHDASGGIYVRIDPGSAALAPGTQIEMDGVSARGDFAPVIENPKVRVTGMGGLPPKAPRVSLVELQSGVDDSQWVEVEGIVHSVYVNGDQAILELAMTDGSIQGSVLKQPGVDYARFIDAEEVLRATAAAVFNENQQLIGARLVLPNLSTVQVLEAAPADPFAMPIQPITEIARFSRQLSAVHRVHLRGRVTLVWPGSLVCIEDGGAGLCAQTLETPDLRPGMKADVVGFPAKGQSAPILTDARVRRVEGRVPEERPLTGAAVLTLANDAKLVEIEGQVVGTDLSASDTTLVVSSQQGIFSAVLPKTLTTMPIGAWPNGSKIRLRGICAPEVDSFRSVQVGGTAVPKGFRLLLRSPADVMVLSKPSWWSPNHSYLVVSGVLIVTILILGWAAALRRTVERQTKTIRESETRFRHLAQHDGLTGLATRALLNDRLNEGLERCRRDGTGLALLMVDLDHFKAINDTYGHDAGDMALKVTAERMVAAVRGGDTVARMGGDEFIVLLTDVSDVSRVEDVAAELVRVVSRPFEFEGREIPMSASVGVCASLSGQFDAPGLLKSVDGAMYRAKAQGRNRFQMAGPMMAIAARG